MKLNKQWLRFRISSFDAFTEYIIEKLRNLKVVASGDLVVHSSGAIQQSEAFASHFLAVYLVN